MSEIILVYCSLDIICSSNHINLLELRSRKTVRILEQIISADKYPCIFSRQIEAVVNIATLDISTVILYSTQLNHLTPSTSLLEQISTANQDDLDE